MQVQLKGPKKLAGKLYKKGVHELPDALLDDWFLKALLKDGDAVLVEKAITPIEAAPPKGKAAAKSAPQPQSKRAS